MKIHKDHSIHVFILGYLKAMQAFEISALILTVISVAAWLGIVLMSALKQKRKSVILILYIVVAAFGLLTGR